MHSIAEKMRLSKPTTKIWMKIDLYYQRQKCRPMTTFWRYKVYADIRGGSLGRDVKRQWGCRQRQFSAFSLAVSSETLEMRPALLYSDTQSLVGFSAIPKCVTLNDFELLFGVKFFFAPICLASDLRLLKIIAWKVKTNKNRHILSAAQIFGRDFGFWQYKVCAHIRAGSLERV